MGGGLGLALGQEERVRDSARYQGVKVQGLIGQKIMPGFQVGLPRVRQIQGQFLQLGFQNIFGFKDKKKENVLVLLVWEPSIHVSYNWYKGCFCVGIIGVKGQNEKVSFHNYKGEFTSLASYQVGLAHLIDFWISPMCFTYGLGHVYGLWIWLMSLEYGFAYYDLIL